MDTRTLPSTWSPKPGTPMSKSMGFWVVSSRSSRFLSRRLATSPSSQSMEMSSWPKPAESSRSVPSSALTRRSRPPGPSVFQNAFLMAFSSAVRPLPPAALTSLRSDSRSPLRKSSMKLAAPSRPEPIKGSSVLNTRALRPSWILPSNSSSPSRIVPMFAEMTSHRSMSSNIEAKLGVANATLLSLPLPVLALVAATPSSSAVRAVVANPATAWMALRAVRAVVSPASMETVNVRVRTLKDAVAAPGAAVLRKTTL